MTYRTREITRRRSVQGGEPCITGTRLPSRAVFTCFMSGLSIEALRRYFTVELTTEQVEIAIRFEMRKSRRKP